MPFADSLALYLPSDLPHRDRLIQLSAKHLQMIAEMNEVMNLTRIVDARDAAVKHVVDSVLPWRHFAKANTVVDIGTGAGYPGIPLAIVLPEIRFKLAESVQKKARFVESAVQALELPNVTVLAERGEAVLTSMPRVLITARAVTPLVKAVPLLAAALRSGSKAILYKGSDVESEIEIALPDAKRRRIRIGVVERYELPEEFGARTLVRLEQM